EIEAGEADRRHCGDRCIFQAHPRPHRPAQHRGRDGWLINSKRSTPATTWIFGATNSRSVLTAAVISTLLKTMRGTSSMRMRPTKSHAPTAIWNFWSTALPHGPSAQTNRIETMTKRYL